MKASPESVQLDIFLMNGQKVALDIKSTDRTDDVLEVSHYHIFLFRSVTAMSTASSTILQHHSDDKRVFYESKGI